MDGFWNENQWQMIVAVIRDELENSRLAQQIVAKYAISADARSVMADTYDNTRRLIDDTTPPLVLRDSEETFTVTKIQAEEPALTTALQAIRRATQRLARGHDLAVFRVAIADVIDRGAPSYVGPGIGASGNFHPVVPVLAPFNDGIVTATAEAVERLDGEGYRSGYVMVAGQAVWIELHRRSAGIVDLPRVAVQALMDDGPIHRTAVLSPDDALILSVVDSPAVANTAAVEASRIDRAVAVEPTLEYLRIGQNDSRDLRVYERFITRFKETLSVVVLRLDRSALASGATASEGGGKAASGGGGKAPKD
jgi:hypothetical protein